MDLQKLKAELQDDPLTRGYSGMTDAAAAATFAVRDRFLDADTIDGGMIRGAIVWSEYDVLLAPAKAKLNAMMAAGSGPFSQSLKTELGSMFLAGSQTRANFIAMLKKSAISRGEELGLGSVGAHHVAEARAS